MMKMKRKLRDMRELTRGRMVQALGNEDGIGVVEVILILVVLIGLVLIFKEQLTTIVETIFSKISTESSGI